MAKKKKKERKKERKKEKKSYNVKRQRKYQKHACQTC